MSVSLSQRVLEAAREKGLEALLMESPLVLGVSGGADSLALLHILYGLRSNTTRQGLLVAHLDHGFRDKEAKEDALFVCRTAEKLGLRCTVAHFDVPAYAREHKLSDEDAARQVRYSFLSQVASEVHATVTVGHNADDQAETVLMNILRGAGVSGLGGMKPLTTVDIQAISFGRPTQAPVQEVHLFRPLLTVWRSEIEQYCRDQGLQPREDATNKDTHYKRNSIRHELLPLLESHYSPSVKHHLVTLSRIASAEDRLLEELVDDAWAGAVTQSSKGDYITLDVCTACRFDVALRRRLVRRGIGLVAATLNDFDFGHIESVARLLEEDLNAPSHLDLPHGVKAGREGHKLWLAKAETAHAAIASITPAYHSFPTMRREIKQEVRPGSILSLGTGWTLQCSLIDRQHVVNTPGDLVALFDADQLSAMGRPVLRTRRAGDTIQPIGMDGRKTLQDLFVDAKIPRRVRDEVPVLALSSPPGEVLWVAGAGGRRSGHAPVSESTTHVVAFELSREQDKMEGQ